MEKTKKSTWRGYALGWIENEYSYEMSKSELADAVSWTLESAEKKGARAVLERIQDIVDSTVNDPVRISEPGAWHRGVRHLRIKVQRELDLAKKEFGILT